MSLFVCMNVYLFGLLYLIIVLTAFVILYFVILVVSYCRFYCLGEFRF